VRRAATALLALAVLAAPAQARAADRAPALPNAKSAIVIDGRNGEVMFAKRAGARREIASTTKLMTALLTLERTRPRQVFRASGYRPAAVESQIGLRPGERMSVADLFEALMLESANDAAETLAEGIAGSRGAFVAAMNARARQLGLDDTSYANPIGLDDPRNYSSARDLAKLTFDLMQRPRFARIVDMPEAELESGARPRVVENRNDLVASYPWVSGVKTGYTQNAGNVLVGAANGPGGVRVISVVLGEPSEGARDQDTLVLLRWGLGRFRRVRVLDPRRMLAQADVKYRDSTARLVPRRPTVLTLREGERIRRRVNAPDEVEGPLEAGARVGTVTVLLDGRPARRVALVTAEDVPEAGTLRVLLSWLGVPLTLILVLAILVAAVLALVKLSVRIRIVR